jgi:hypothetical protein
MSARPVSLRTIAFLSRADLHSSFFHLNGIPSGERKHCASNSPSCAVSPRTARVMRHLSTQKRCRAVGDGPASESGCVMVTGATHAAPVRGNNTWP